ncbi:WD repeat-containing protein 76 [Selaginella moellendorffii]|nr:WD repeat-containing protein 76 [Selaginella moellendorffii]|eukprot:XP_002964849.2 WD repeat-containing protein 76 [Selaginella moellendorffii]
MADPRMSDYARKRAENMARNAEKLAELGIHEAAKFLQIPIREQQKRKPKGYKSEKRPRDEQPLVIRRSLRTRGISPEVGPLKDELSDAKVVPEPEKLDKLNWEKPVSFSDVRVNDEPSDDSVRARIGEAVKGECLVNSEDQRPKDDFEPLSLKLAEKDVVRIVPEKILSLILLPLSSKLVVAAGDRAGNIGLWDADYNDESDESVVHIYRPHRIPVTAIASAPASFTQIATCSCDGSVLLMDIDKAAFSRVFLSDESLSAMSYLAESTHVISIGDYEGDMKLVDARSSTVASHWKLHERRIHSIDSTPQRPHQVATSSGDGTVSLWDVRVTKRNLATMTHGKAVHSAYFSPSGDQLASTSYDDHVGLWSGKHNNDPVMISHNNQTNRWIATFRAIWSWSDNYVYIANMSRAIDVISTRENKLVASLRSEEMTSIPSRLARHPLLPGVLAGGTAGGKIFLWRS